MNTTLEIRQPDDWHVHLRDGQQLKAVAPWTARHFSRAIVMPNLKTPITTVALGKSYRERILQATGPSFVPLMTFYLTDQTNLYELETGINQKLFVAAKLYPANATTHSAAGVTDISKITKALALLEKMERPLLVHAESADPQVDVFDREKVFLEKTLTPILHQFPKLKVVVEHITTEDAVNFVRAHAPRVAATITVHHLMINRNAMFAGGIRPHYYCLPVAKREKHRQALVRAATSGESCFFLGTDSAPHSTQAKESACGCAGIFSAPTALSLYASIFSNEDKLNHLENFTSVYGPKFYDLPLNETKITLRRQTHTEPTAIKLSENQEVLVFEGGKELEWSMELVR